LLQEVTVAVEARGNCL